MTVETHIEADCPSCGTAGHRECANRLEFLLDAVVERIGTGKEIQKWMSKQQSIKYPTCLKLR